MSTDKTLADVQPGGRVRLGDQAEPLDSELLWWLMDAASTLYEGGNESHAEHLRALHAALSAQPSPGGQGDALVSDDMVQAFKAALARAQLPGKNRTYFLKDSELPSILCEVLAARQPVYEGHTWVSDYVLAGLRERAALPLQMRNGEVWHWQGDGHDFPESLVCPVIMSAETLRALLAARQPVEFERAMPTRRRESAVELLLQLGFVWNNQRWEDRRQPVGEPVERLVEAIEGECNGLAISTQTAASILAHVFPTGQVATAYMVDGRIEQGLFFDRAAAKAMAAMNAGEVVPLFRSPAQAVDLGQFRRAVRWAVVNAVTEDFKNYAEGLLALIDSQAVGNG